MSDIFTHHGGDQVILEFLEAMAIPFAAEVNIFDPDRVVIGRCPYPFSRIIFKVSSRIAADPSRNFCSLFSLIGALRELWETHYGEEELSDIFTHHGGDLASLLINTGTESLSSNSFTTFRPSKPPVSF